MSKDITLKPKLSEKTYAQSLNRVYAFEVPRDANKHTVARAVEAQFDVKVTEVNIANKPGKAKRTISQGGRRVAQGRDAATKKAYVTLAEGNSLPFFAAIEEAEEKQADTQAKVEKAAEKSAAKEAKKESKAKKAEEKK
jgi:large subunit ribosomal protein L23